jgi:hypothetical protein
LQQFGYFFAMCVPASAMVVREVSVFPQARGLRQQQVRFPQLSLQLSANSGQLSARIQL